MVAINTKYRGTLRQQRLDRFGVIAFRRIERVEIIIRRANQSDDVGIVRIRYRTNAQFSRRSIPRFRISVIMNFTLPAHTSRFRHAGRRRQPRMMLQ